MVGWCRLNPVESRVERDWFQSLKLKYDELLSNLNLRHCNLDLALQLLLPASSWLDRVGWCRLNPIEARVDAPVEAPVDATQRIPQRSV
jgi:hypothetical protein